MTSPCDEKAFVLHREMTPTGTSHEIAEARS